MNVEVDRLPEVAPLRKPALQIPQRFFSLDAVRGLAALSVIFWHWQHFFYHGIEAAEYDRTAQPFYPLFFVFYNKGWIAVDFFFSLSGFIFFWLYSERVAARDISGRNFALLRFSRLYPLHLLALGVVLVGQSVIYHRTGQFFVYPFNDVYHFILNLLFASSWGFERGFSFNAPTSSVSIEILIYALFFILCLKGGARPWMLAPLVLAGLILLRFQPLLGRGLFSFFLGGLVFYTYAAMVKAGWVERWVGPFAWVMIAGWVVALLEGRFDLIPLGRKSAALAITGVLFPMTILALALIETKRGHLGERLSPLGDISYSLYLLHFPLQLTFMIAIGSIGWSPSFFYTKTSMLVFFTILIGLCTLSYRFLERPAQRILRDKFMA
ncbi:MAG: acyltransferase [Nitrospirae bacterium]|nr:acyltransferase [Candidatus Manganitrophaceae bacterium]